VTKVTKQWIWANVYWYVSWGAFGLLCFAPFWFFVIKPDLDMSPWERAFRHCVEGHGLTMQRVDACKVVAAAAEKETP